MTHTNVSPVVRLARAAVFLLSIVALSAAAQAQTGRIAGQLTDASDGTPLVGASVRLEGTTLGAASGADGRFDIAAVPLGHTRLPPGSSATRPRRGA